MELASQKLACVNAAKKDDEPVEPNAKKLKCKKRCSKSLLSNGLFQVVVKRLEHLLPLFTVRISLQVSGARSASYFSCLFPAFHWTQMHSRGTLRQCSKALRTSLRFDCIPETLRRPRQSRSKKLWQIRMCRMLVVRMLLVAMPGAPSSVLAPSKVLVAMLGAPSSVLVSSSKARSP